ncbi:hypothetical protein [uncultured Methanobrevibacter sp.]|uniref:hypothetical protein n=1 Tax=uncultured Methanobrevibacter sp. TaxID=253161 RepID=UPI0025F17394|nr:hypothetical protein [uncultured Methanobrevibacter sp.]
MNCTNVGITFQMLFDEITVILYSLEYTAREVRILDFSKVEVVQPILTGSKPNQDYLIRFFCNLNNLGFFD